MSVATAAAPRFCGGLSGGGGWHRGCSDRSHDDDFPSMAFHSSGDGGHGAGGQGGDDDDGDAGAGGRGGGFPHDGNSQPGV
jgi:hypothetical protein